MTTSDNANSSSSVSQSSSTSSSPIPPPPPTAATCDKSDDDVVQMISVKARLAVHHQQDAASGAVRGENSPGIPVVDRGVLDMSPPMRGPSQPPPTTTVASVQGIMPEGLRACFGPQQTNLQTDVQLKGDHQWMMTNGRNVTSGDHRGAGATIHRKSFNIDALLAKSQTTTTMMAQEDPQRMERFVSSPESANECYSEDRRDFTPSPEGHNFR